MRQGCIKNIIDSLGEPIPVNPISKEVLDRYENIMPPILLEIWQQEGFCQFQQGLYNIINPDDWQDVVDVWIENTVNRDQPSRVLLLCQSHAGYLLLCQLISRSYLTNQYRGRAEFKREWFDECGTEGWLHVGHCPRCCFNQPFTVSCHCTLFCGFSTQ